MRLLAVLGAALLLTGPVAGSAQYLESRQAESGGFSEPGRAPDAATTAWATLGLAAADAPAETLAPASRFLAAREDEARSDTDVALQLMARSLAGDDAQGLVRRLQEHRSGRLVNADIWTVLALRQAGAQSPPAIVQAILRAQAPSGGWPWARGGAPDSNDTAAAVQALRALGVRGRPIRRGLAYLRRLQNADGGFELVTGRGSDAQSTAWVVQAFRAAGRPAPSGALPYLRRLRRPDGSYRYSTRYDATPVWVTAQVLPALAGKPFPLR